MVLHLCDLPEDVTECILHSVVIPMGKLRRSDVILLVKLCSTCQQFRKILNGLKEPMGIAKHPGRSLFDYFGVTSWEQLAIVAALIEAQEPDGGQRIGFEFASERIARESGGSSDVRNSRARIAAHAAILRRHKRVVASIEAHTGPTAPPGIADHYCMRRAELVAHELQRCGCDQSQLRKVSHGLRVSSSQAILQSKHPNAHSAKCGYGWAEIFLQIDGIELPARPDFYQGHRPAHGPRIVDEDDAVGGHARRRCVIS